MLEMAPSYQIVFLRHGESEYNKANRFCGWHDADLTPQGVGEAHSAGALLREKGYSFDLAFCSMLKRAVKTLNIVLDELDAHWVPVEKSWRLNERMYGALQGLNKSETAAQYGEAQVKVWRRSFDTQPPAVEPSDSRWPGNAPMFAQLDPAVLPRAECLQDTIARVLPYWFDSIVPSLRAGRKIIVSAHGNSLRGLIKFLDNMGNDEIMELNIPTGCPLVYEFDADMKPIRHYYLATAEEIEAATNKVANQGKA